MSLLCPTSGMVCAVCRVKIRKGAPILRARAKGSAVTYGHKECVENSAPIPEPKPRPVPDPASSGGSLPVGWVTHDLLETLADQFEAGSLVGDASGSAASGGSNDRRELAPGSADGDAGAGGEANEAEPGESPGDGEAEAGSDGEGEPGSDSESEADAESGSESEAASDDGDGSEGEGEADDASGGEESEQGKPGERPEPKDKPKLEDFPPDLLAKIVALAAGIAESRVAARIEPRLSELVTEHAEPITAALAAKFQAGIGDTVREQLAGEVVAARGKAERLLEGLSKEIGKRVEDEARRLDSVRPSVIRIERPDKSLFDFPEGSLVHCAFPEVLRLVSAGFDVFLPGPTGCGKTVLAEQVAQALGVPFALVSGSEGTTENELLGNSTPDISRGESVFQPSEFLKVYEGGGLFLLDEADAMNPNALLKLNAAIANGFCPVPKRRERPIAKRHERFSFVMAANTWGTGATRLYCGRTRLDEATLDRFRAGTVPMNYDPAIERQIVGDVALYKTLAGWRERIMANNIQRVLSTRFMAHAARLKALGYTVKDIGEKLCGGWTATERARVLG